MKSRISVIVPVYMAEMYLPLCIDSILNQSWDNQEILLLDDGSTDRSGKICDCYATKDDRIRVFHRTNSGVAATRQFGVEQCTGRYCIHVDSDDWIDPDFLEKLAIPLEADDNTIMSWCDYSLETPDGSRLISQAGPETEKDCLIGFLTGRLHSSCCNKLIRISAWRESGSFFPAGLNMCEDLFAMSSFLCMGGQVRYVPNVSYHYRVSQNSLTHARSRASFDSEQEVVRRLQESLGEEFHPYLLLQKLRIKREMFYSGHFSNKELQLAYSEIPPVKIFATPYPLHEKAILFLLLKQFIRLAHLMNKLIRFAKGISL